jgi:hypothetical protein
VGDTLGDAVGVEAPRPNRHPAACRYVEQHRDDLGLEVEPVGLQPSHRADLGILRAAIWQRLTTAALDPIEVFAIRPGPARRRLDGFRGLGVGLVQRRSRGVRFCGGWGVLIFSLPFPSYAERSTTIRRIGVGRIGDFRLLRPIDLLMMPARDVEIFNSVNDIEAD